MARTRSRKNASRPKTARASKVSKASRTRPSRQEKTGKMGISDADLLRLIREDVWPVERKVLFNPERLRYVRKLIQPKGCVFCAAVEKGRSFESLLLHEREHAIVVLNKYPYNNGHLLILPRRHCGEFLELTSDEHREMNECLQLAIRSLSEVYQPPGFNVGLNLGSAAGAGIPEHLHFHVVPRWAGDTNFFALLADTKVVVETLEQTYERLLPFFEGPAPVSGKGRGKT